MQRFSHHPINEDWLAARQEVVLDKHQPIIDAHHHLFDRPGQRYLPEHLKSDIGRDLNVVATVLVQARSFYRTDGPEAFQPVGETEFAAGVAEAALTAGGPKLCAAIVGYADLNLGDSVRPVLEAHICAGRNKFRGIRHIIAWDKDKRLLNPAYPTTESLMDSKAFQSGFSQLADLGLSFDAWLYFPQIPRLTALARQFPSVHIVLNHCGGILGLGAYAGRRDDVFKQWRAAMSDLATCLNVSVKIGGLGMSLSGFDFDKQLTAPSSETLSITWRPWVETCFEFFSANRCMFESNFPVDKGSYGYVVGWNAMMRLASKLTTEERDALFYKTAASVYDIKNIE